MGPAGPGVPAADPGEPAAPAGPEGPKGPGGPVKITFGSEYLRNFKSLMLYTWWPS